MARFTKIRHLDPALPERDPMMGLELNEGDFSPAVRNDIHPMKQFLKQIPMFQVLKIRPFVWLWTAQLLTFIASNMLLFVLGVLIYSQTRLNTHVSLLYLAVGIPATIFGLGSGLIVDMLDKKRLLFWSTLVRAGILLLILVSHQNLTLVLVGVAIFTAFGQVFIPAEASLIPRIVPVRLLFAANSLFTMTFYASIIGGFVLGGPALDFLGINTLMSAFVAVYVIAALLTLLLPKNLDREIKNKKITLESLVADFKFLLKFIRQATYVGRALLLTTVIQVVVTIFMILGPGFVDKILFIKLTDASVVILGPAAVGMIIGAVSMGVLGHKFKKRTLIYSGVLIGGLLLLFLSGFIKFTQAQNIGLDLSNYMSHIQASLLPVTVVSMFLLGICVSLIDVSCNTILQERTSDEVRGRVYGMLSTLISGVSLLPVVISGVLADIIGIEQIILFLGFILVGFGIYIGKKYPAN